MKRMKTNLNNIKNKSGTMKTKEREAWDSNTKLQCLEIDNEDPLSVCDWKQMSMVINEVNALAWIQFLPAGCKAS
jgi:hypothetical protein